MDGLDEFELNKFIGDVHYIHAASLQSYDRLSCFGKIQIFLFF